MQTHHIPPLTIRGMAEKRPRILHLFLQSLLRREMEEGVVGEPVALNVLFPVVVEQAEGSTT